MAGKRKAPPRRTFVLDLDGDLAGFTVTMSGLTGADMLRIRSGEMIDTDSIDLFADHVIESNFDVADHRDLEFWIILQIMQAWTAAINEAAAPEASGDS